MDAILERADLIPLADQKEAESSAGVIEKPSLRAVVSWLIGQNPPGVVVFDVDGTIRDTVGAGLHLRFGEIESGVMELLRSVKEAGWKVFFVTNQPEEGHQVAGIRARLTGGYYFPGSLVNEFGRESVIGSGADFLSNRLKGREDKINEKGVTRVAAVIAERVKTDLPVVMVGDRNLDIQFAAAVHGRLSGNGWRGRPVMLKLPESATFRLFGRLAP